MNRNELREHIQKRLLFAQENGKGIRLNNEEVNALLPAHTDEPVLPGTCNKQRPTFKINVIIRWLIRRDMEHVLDIERQSYSPHWQEDDFLSALRQRNCIGMIAEHGHRVVGYMIYELHKEQLTVLKMAVRPDDRRCGIASQMLLRLVDKLSQQRRTNINITISEYNDIAMKVLKGNKFEATGVAEGWIDFTYDVRNPGLCTVKGDTYF